MSSDRKEAFRQWTAVSVSGLALLVSVLRGPVSLTVRATIEDMLRQEMAKQQISPAAEARAHQRKEIGETLIRLDAELTALRANAALEGATQKRLMEINACLLQLESRLDSWEKDALKERAARKPQTSDETP